MIYVLEDDANIRKLVDYALTREGYSVEGFGTPAEFWAASGTADSAAGAAGHHAAPGGWPFGAAEASGAVRIPGVCR